MNIKKEDFQVYDKHLGNDGGAYKKLGKGTWYNDEMYQEALNQGETLPIDSVIVTLLCDVEKGTKCKDPFPKYRTGVCRNCGGQSN